MGFSLRFSKRAADVDRGKHFGVLGAPATCNPHRWGGPIGRVRWQDWFQGWQLGRRERIEARIHLATRQKGGV